jgi:hypothetical protein
MNREQQRLQQDVTREQNWKRWGPYLPDRQWSTVREDYSADGDAWNYFPHDMARSRAYRWGEDGLLGICDRQCRLCFSFAFWNEADPFLKERLFGLTGHEGNHGEDVKECYFFLDSTPTHSYMRALYKYPCGPFPYEALRRENRRRSRREPEFELYHTDSLHEYFDCYVEYAKGGPDDILIRLSVVNHSDADRTLTVLPTCWFRNVWSWGREDEGYGLRPTIEQAPDGGLLLTHPELGVYRFWVDQQDALFVFTENETNAHKLFGGSNSQPYVKDAFHRFVVDGEQDAVNPDRRGTKAAAVVRLHVPAGETAELRCRLAVSAEGTNPFGRFEVTMARALREADEFYSDLAPPSMGKEEMLVWRQALAGLFWSKKFYHYAPSQWMEGDPAHPPPPPQRRRGRNRRWVNHLYNRDVLLMPDAWEYPWYAAWDTAFHVVPLARVDPDLAKTQLVLLLREWYMHPNGQLPAYEWNFDDVNPPVHAWAAWRIYREDGARDTAFLGRIFHKLLLNFNWWINRTDRDGNNIFSGGFLGLDNVGAFDRSQLPPQMGELEQADATAWLAFYCLQMLQIALELAQTQPAYEDIASKFFEHFVAITSAMNGLGALGLWDDEDGFYYDLLHKPSGEPCRRLKVRSMVGLLPLIAVDYLEGERLRKLPGFLRRMEWFIKNRPHLSQHLERKADTILLAVATRERLRRVLGCMLDPEEFLSPYGVRSLSRRHAREPYVLQLGGHSYRVGYEPGDSESGMFGGNSNWRGPVWFPVNYLLIGALEQYHKFYGNSLKVPAPDGSGRSLNLHQAADEIRRRLVSLFLPDAGGVRPSHRDCPQHTRPGWQQAVWFHEFFHGETGQGLGASHQTGWTALVAPLLEQLAEGR